jgi:hypothetical protein
MKRGNKAQSNIITTVLILLLIVAGVVILSSVVINFVKNEGGDIATPTMINSVIKDAYAISGGNDMDVVVNRNIGKGNLSIIIFNLMDSSSAIHRANLTNPPKEGETLTYKMNAIFGSVISNFSNIKKVSIQYGIIDRKGKVTITNIISEFEIKSAGSGSTGCINGQTQPATGTNPCKTYIQTCTAGVWVGPTETGNKPSGSQCIVGAETGMCDAAQNCWGPELIDNIYLNTTADWQVGGTCGIFGTGIYCSGTAGNGNLSEKNPFIVEIGKTYNTTIVLHTPCNPGNGFGFSVGGAANGGQNSLTTNLVTINNASFSLSATNYQGVCPFRSISIKKKLN